MRVASRNTGCRACCTIRAGLSHSPCSPVGRLTTVPARLMYAMLSAPSRSMRACTLFRSMLPLKGCRLIGGLAGFVDDYIHVDAARHFLMQARGREVHIARHVLALLNRGLADQVLRAAALMRGHDVLVPIHFLNRFFQMIEVAATRVGFIAQHHARPLAIAHGVGAAVGEQIDVDVVRFQQERVEAGFVQGALASGRSVMVNGSTILIFQRSAQDRRPNCWPIVWGVVGVMGIFSFKGCGCGER